MLEPVFTLTLRDEDSGLIVESEGKRPETLPVLYISA